MLYAEAAAGAPTYTHAVTPVIASRVLDPVPSVPSPYFPGQATPNIVADSPDGPGLDGGPAPFGLLPAGLADAAIDAAIAGAPPGASAVLLRFDLGPSGFALGYNVSNVLSSNDDLDLFVLVNLFATPASLRIEGEPIARLPVLTRQEFGGSGVPVPVALPGGRAWATPGPELGTVTLTIGLHRGSDIAVVPNPADDGATVVYLIPECDPDVNCDGVPDQGDVACMILAVAGDLSCFCQPDPDFNLDGVPDQGDVADMILVVAGAPCP